VSRGNVAIFFRKHTPTFEAAVQWGFAEDIDATYDEVKFSASKIVEPLENEAWGLRQFTVENLDGNRFYFHHFGRRPKQIIEALESPFFWHVLRRVAACCIPGHPRVQSRS
jgi:hypothetical protein